MPVYVHLLPTPLTEGRSERGLEFGTHVHGRTHIHMRVCTHAHTPCSSLKRENAEYSEEILQGYRRQILMLMTSNERRKLPFRALSGRSEDDETKLCPWFHVTWGHVSLGALSSNEGVQTLKSREAQGFAFPSERHSSYKRTFRLRLISKIQILPSGLRIRMDRKGYSTQSQALFS